MKPYIGIYEKEENGDLFLCVALRIRGTGMDYGLIYKFTQLVRLYGITAGCLIENDFCDFASYYAREFLQQDRHMWFTLTDDNITLWHDGEEPKSYNVPVLTAPGMRLVEDGYGSSWWEPL